MYVNKLDAREDISRGSIQLFIRDNVLMYLLYNEYRELRLCKAIYNSQELSLSLFLRFVFEREPFLRQKVASNEVISSSNKFTLIPGEFVSQRDRYHYARIMMEDSVYDDEVFTHQIDHTDIQTIFISPPYIHHLLAEYMPDYRLTHISSYNYQLAKSLSIRTPTHLLMHVYDNMALITAFKEGALYLSNIYEYRTGAGILYFIQSVFDVIEVDEHTRLHLIGDLATSEPWYQQLMQKIPNTSIPKVDEFRLPAGVDHPNYWQFAFLL